MVRPHPTAVALLAALSRCASAAVPASWEQDEVALVQRVLVPRSGAVELAQEVALVQHKLADVLSKHRQVKLAGVPLSLLAMNASSTTAKRWYDMDDGLLLQKLTDRMRANEEKEQEEVAAAQDKNADGVPNGAALLRQSAPDTHSTTDITQWLTQSDLDHYAEDERRLHQLSVELQRVAATIARIASHQKEIGLHLGLPDPTTAKFDIGDKVELQIGEGKLAGHWVKAVIIGVGDRPNTYNIHVPSVRHGSKDMANVAAVVLRKDEEANLKVFEPGEAKYEIGESAQVQIAVGPAAGSWVRCSIRSKADLPDTYNIHVPSAPPGHRDIPSVPARVLRKAESKALFSQYDMDGDGLMSNEEFQVAMREKANSVYQESHHLDALFHEGDKAEVLSKEGATNGAWVNCTIVGDGDLANSFNIFVPSAPVGFQYTPNILVERLRKVGENKTAPDEDTLVHVVPDIADQEVLLQKGPYKGKWVPCQIKRQSDAGDTYTVWVPFGAPDGRSILPNVPPEQLRKRMTCGDGYDTLFDADSPGYDHYDRQFNRKETVDDCAADCSKRFSCRSYEWSPVVKECHLNKVADPSLPGNGDYLFCRRKSPPESPAELWSGPWIGQDMEFLMTVGEHSGEWHPCKLMAFGERPDTYDVLAEVGFLTKSQHQQFANLSSVPGKFLRYSPDKPLALMWDNWEPPRGDDALYVKIMNETENNGTASLAEAAPGSAANATPETAMEAAPGPAANATPVTAAEAAPGPAANATPVTPADQIQAAPGPAANATPVTAAEAVPGAVADAAAAATATAQTSVEVKPPAVVTAVSEPVESVEKATPTSSSEAKPPQVVTAVSEPVEPVEKATPTSSSEVKPQEVVTSVSESVEPVEKAAPTSSAEVVTAVSAPAEKAAPTGNSDPAAPSDSDAELDEGVFHVGQTAEVKQAGSWVRCQVMSAGDIVGSYNLLLPSAPAGSQELVNIPAVAMRKAQEPSKETQLPAAILDEDGIEGEIGESVEVLVHKGPHAGEWVPAIIKGKGDDPDSYNIKVPKVNSTNEYVPNVPGSMLRKTNKTVEIVEVPQFPLYKEGERATVMVQIGPSNSITYNCTIKAKGAQLHTYDLEVPSFGSYPAVHARYLQKLPAQEAAIAEEEQAAISLRNLMQVVEVVREDMLPVFLMLMEAKKDVRMWIRRAIDWQSGCEKNDRVRFSNKLQELASLPRDAVAEALPEQCSLQRWTSSEGFPWDDVAACLQLASNTSRACANCPVRFMMNVAEKCLAKCQPMMNTCRDATSQDTRSCHAATGRCLDCLEGPVDNLMECVDVPDRLGVLASISQMIKNSKAGHLQVEDTLRNTLDASSFLQADEMAKLGLRALLFSWDAFVHPHTNEED